MTEITCGGYLRRLSLCWKLLGLCVCRWSFSSRSLFRCLARVQFPTQWHWLGTSLKWFYISTALLTLTKPVQHQTDINHQWIRPWGVSVSTRVQNLAGSVVLSFSLVSYKQNPTHFIHCPLVACSLFLVLIPLAYKYIIHFICGSQRRR